MIRRNYRKIKWMYQHWKQGVHIILGTRHFGVNNEWWPRVDMALSWHKIIWNIITIKPLIFRYHMMKIRATELGFLHPDTCKMLGWYRPQNQNDFSNQEKTQIKNRHI